MGKWVRIDRRYNNPYRLTRYANRVITTWVAVVIVVIAGVHATHGWFAIPAGAALASYAGYRVRARRRVLLAGRPAVRPAAQFAAPALRFNPPQGGQRPSPAGRRRLAGSPTRPGPSPRLAGISGSQAARRQSASGTPGPSPKTSR